LMDYWDETMQDDVYVLTQDGWQAGKSLRELVVKKGEKLKESADLIIGKIKYKAELIPPELIAKRYFKQALNEINEIQTTLDGDSQELESYIEEYNVESGLLADAQTDAGKISKTSVTERLKLATEQDEIAALKKCKKLIEAEATSKKTIKEAQEKLDKEIYSKYSKLTEEDIKTLVVNDKWLAKLESDIRAEIERVTQQLSNRVKTLEERYAQPLPKIIVE